MIAEISTADIVTTAVGPTILRFVAPVIVAGLRGRSDDSPPLVVMACENAINATDVLTEFVRALVPDDAEWAACRRRRSSPTPRSIASCRRSPPSTGLDVTVESYFEWAIERPPFGGQRADDPGRHLGRRSRAVHRAKAVHRQHRSRLDRLPRASSGASSKLSDALADDVVRAKVEGVLAETKRLLVDKHEFAPEAQQAYVDKILGRFANPYLPDTVDRVGRQPLRKTLPHRAADRPGGRTGGAGRPPDSSCSPPSRRPCISMSRRTRKASS